MCLAAKNLDWKGHHVSIARFEQFDPAYVALNRKSLVPTLVHDGAVMTESSIINEYLDEIFPNPALRPITPLSRATMRAWIKEEENAMFPLVRIVSFELSIKRRAELFGEEQLRVWAARCPDATRADHYLSEILAPVHMNLVDEAGNKFRAIFRRMADAVGVGPWIIGETFSLADIAIAPIFCRLDYLGLDRLWNDSSPVAAWFERIKAHPAYVLSAPPDDQRLPEPRAA